VSYNGSGTFNINTAGQPVVTGTVISSTAFNALTADLGTGLSTALTKDGQTVATARIPFAQGINSSLVTDATSTTTGSIITAGGVGIAKALYVGTTLNVTGASTLAGITGTFNGTVGATTPSTGAFTTLSATGALTAPSSYSWTAANTPIVVGLSALNYNSSGIYSKYSFNAYHNGTNDIYMSGSGYGATQIFSYSPGSGNLKIQTAVGGTGTITWVDTAVFSPTGLAVTGTLSATTTGKVGTTLGVGAATPSASGAGITFPATQSASTDANTLDDYEEGTFTATLTGSTTNPTTPVTATSAYTKTGNVVNFKISFENVNTTGAAGQIIITGLPFTPANGYRAIAPCVFYSIATFTGAPIGMIDNNLASIYFYSSQSLLSWSNVTHNAGTTRYLSVSGFYTTT